MSERDVVWESKVIDWAISEFKLEAIMLWLEENMPPAELKNLERAFKRFLLKNPKAYQLMISEYGDAYQRLPKNWGK